MFYKNIDYESYEDMYDFLNNHFTYFTLNSWNGLKSIANNVKLYNLPVDVDKALEALQDDDYFTINLTIRNWEQEHPGYEVGFNGRSSGYLVLCNDNNYQHVFNKYSNSPIHYDDYKLWKEDVIRDYGSLENYKSELIEQVKLVQEFDKLCDDLVDCVNDLINQLEDRKSRTHKYSATLRLQTYTYKTLKEKQYHILDMKNRGCKLKNDGVEKDEFWATYEMNEKINSQVIVQYEGEEII